MDQILTVTFFLDVKGQGWQESPTGKWKAILRVCSIALDGKRDVTLKAGDTITVNRLAWRATGAIGEHSREITLSRWQEEVLWTTGRNWRRW